MRRTTEIDKIIAENLRRLVGKERGAQTKLAEKIGLSIGSVNSILQARQHAGPVVVASLAQALGVKEVDLYQLQISHESIALAKAKQSHAASEDAEKYLKAVISLVVSVRWTEARVAAVERVCRSFRTKKQPHDNGRKAD